MSSAIGMRPGGYSAESFRKKFAADIDGLMAYAKEKGITPRDCSKES